MKTTDGKVAGYKRYPTYEQFLNPVAEVGTYRAEELLSEPAESTPRQCVRRYNESRARLLEHPGRRGTWEEFAALCEALQHEWQQYRQKPGSSNENLSFEAEGRFARELPAKSGWTDMQTLFAP